jgi:hypothetical protein
MAYAFRHSSLENRYKWCRSKDVENYQPMTFLVVRNVVLVNVFVLGMLASDASEVNML